MQLQDFHLKKAEHYAKIFKEDVIKISKESKHSIWGIIFDPDSIKSGNMLGQSQIGFAVCQTKPSKYEKG